MNILPNCLDSLEVVDSESTQNLLSHLKLIFYMHAQTAFTKLSAKLGIFYSPGAVNLFHQLHNVSLHLRTHSCWLPFAVTEDRVIAVDGASGTVWSIRKAMPML